MTSLMWLIPIALGLGLTWLFAFLWTVKSGQYEDPKGDAERIFMDDEDKPIVDKDDL
ncbi:MAG TPA: cbb3-type cytochrome oxidase assembly protein CcoS [Hellea balneolensis]|uniref:Cbb3-type cytochrome oxidase assembly protein CcoS n=1 Tax=Hellea balneolensis TaxID=287478 RepID=A0A7C3G941_9PROT|nr:cbb3-type cytochrome oxidase assembly protein CcoS [Hellea balneolensis]